MSTLTADPPTTSHAATPPAAAQVQPTFAGVVRGEWIKLAVPALDVLVVAGQSGGIA